MAKLTARGAHPVARLKVRTPRGTMLIFALRSDGVILSRFTGELANGYSVWGRKLREGVPFTEETLRKVMDRLHYEVLEVLT